LRSLILLLFLVIFTNCTSKYIQSPAIELNFADPTVINVSGTFYAYATNANNKHIQVAKSADLKHWQLLNDALPQKPSWGNIDFWAPHVLYDEGLKKFTMFYSAAKDNKTPKCIGVAFADKPEGPFTDKGSPLICGSSNDKNNFINIDPMAFIDPATGKKLLYWGSGHEPIKVREMNDDWLSFKETTKPVNLIVVNREKQYDKLIEGAWIDYHDGTYYLYYSGDNCCGASANYAVLVARSNSAMGPFETYGQFKGDNNSVILEKNSAYNAPGHNSIIKDNKGQKWIAYHAIPFAYFNKGRYPRWMYLKRIAYKNGWPKILSKR
jgi:arabinan endo-1,5-alpha-L-arabinosidase